MDVAHMQTATDDPGLDRKTGQYSKLKCKLHFNRLMFTCCRAMAQETNLKNVVNLARFHLLR